jgi:hypothetical protein
MEYAAPILAMLGAPLLLCGFLLILVTDGEERAISKHIAAWGILCLMGSAVCLLLGGI